MIIEYCIKYNEYDGTGEHIFNIYHKVDEAIKDLPFVVENLCCGHDERAWIEARSVSQWQKVKID